MYASLSGWSSPNNLLTFGALLLLLIMTGSMLIIIDSSSAANYQDGVCTGTGTGFKDSTEVQVTVENGNISDITVVSTGDDEEFFNRAKSAIISEVISLQSTQADTVSGAAFSSNGIIGAVANALGILYENPNSTANQQSHGGIRGSPRND